MVGDLLSLQEEKKDSVWCFWGGLLLLLLAVVVVVFFLFVFFYNVSIIPGLFFLNGHL